MKSKSEKQIKSEKIKQKKSDRDLWEEVMGSIYVYNWEVHSCLYIFFFAVQIYGLSYILLEDKAFLQSKIPNTFVYMIEEPLL